MQFFPKLDVSLTSYEHFLGGKPALAENQICTH